MMRSNTKGKVKGAMTMDDENYTPGEIEEPSFPEGEPRVLTSINKMHIMPGELFSQTKEAIFTLNGRKSYANTACVRLLPDTDYVQYLIDPETKMFGLLPCEELDSHSFRWSKEQNGKRYPIQRSGQDFVLMICQIMDWSPKNRYQILGRLTKVEYKGKSVPVVSFDLMYKKCYTKTTTKKGEKSKIIRDWLEMLGPVLEENDRSLRVSSINKYSVMSENTPSSVSTEESASTDPPASAGVVNETQGNADAKKMIDVKPEQMSLIPEQAIQFQGAIVDSETGEIL